MKRIAKYGMLVLAAMLVGFPLGYFYSQRTVGKGSNILSQTYALSEYETLANLQYKQADPLHASRAQLDLLNFMQQLQAKQKIDIPRALDYDRARVIMRLALLEENAGNKEKSKQYILEAQESLKDADHKTYSEEQLRTFVRRLMPNLIFEIFDCCNRIIKGRPSWSRL